MITPEGKQRLDASGCAKREGGRDMEEDGGKGKGKGVDAGDMVRYTVLWVVVGFDAPALADCSGCKTVKMETIDEGGRTSKEDIM